MGRELLREWEINMQNELQVLKVSCEGFCSYIVILVLQVYSNIIKCYEEHSGFRKQCSLLFTALFDPNSHPIFTYSWLTLLFCLLQVPALETELWETDTFSPHPYFIAVSTQLKHFICASQFTFQFKCMFHPGEPHQFLLHTNIICPKESKGYRAKSYKVRQCQNWSFPCNLKLVLVVLQPTPTKLGLGNICLCAAENLFIE